MTLVELLIASALAGAVSGLVVIFYIGAWRNFYAAVDRSARAGRVAGAAVALAGDIRAARGVVAVGPGRLDLWAEDANGDGFMQAGEVVAYRLDATRLTRQGATGSIALLEGVAEAFFVADAPPPGSKRIWLSLRLEGGEAPFVTGVTLENAGGAP